MVSSASNHEETIVLATSNSRLSKLESLRLTQISNVAEVRKKVEQAGPGHLWISFEKRLTDALLRSVHWPSKPMGRAILLHTLSLTSLSVLQKCFQKVVFSAKGGFLSKGDLFEVLQSPRRDELLIGGFVDEASHTVTLWRGNLDQVTVPFSDFKKSGDGVAPNFSTFAVVDCGQTVQFGDYEASAESILYENDPVYRKKVKSRLAEQDISLGGAVRRLRKQRRLSRAEFEPLSEKTIARIERGESTQIRKPTLETIAKKLGVSPNDLQSF